MGFFDKEDRSICGMDLNGDGRKDYCDDFIWEESMRNMFGQESEEDECSENDDFEDLDMEECKEALEYEGSDSDEFECMDEYERREAFEEAGLDFDDFD